MQCLQNGLELFVLIACALINGATSADNQYSKDFIPRESVHVKEGQCHSDQTKLNRLEDVRRLMHEKKLDAYIICNVNENMGKLKPHDRRLESISGFSGRIGTAVITLDKAALWTDGRTFQSAIDDVDCGWTIYRKGGSNSTSLVDWIHDNNVDGSSVGACPYLTSLVWWENFQTIFKEMSIKFIPVYEDLIDLIWTENRAPMPKSQIYIQPLRFAGETWQAKINRTIQKMAERDADVLVLTNLDEIAWLFNLRARDFPFDPYFISFCIINAKNGVLSLYLVNAEEKLASTVDSSGLRLYQFLNTSVVGTCVRPTCKKNTRIYTNDNMDMCEKTDNIATEPFHKTLCVDVREYNPSRFKDDVSKASRDNRVRKVWVSWSCSEAFAEEIPPEKLILDHTPPMALKAAKNGAELEGMINSTLRDSVFLTTYFAGLEKRMKNGDTLITKDLEVEIKKLRQNELYNNGPSGVSLLGFGPMTQHLFPKITDDIVTENDVFLFDMGSQYLDGTTDIARCFVFGTPNERQKDIYTRLLMTQINLAMKTFEAGTTGRDLDSDDVREPLREIGVHFPHEIGHMLAAHGAIVEGPALISNITEDWRSDVPRDRHIFECRKCKKPQDVVKTPNWSDYVLEEGMVFSNEPSFYGKGEFGMRLENTMFITTGQCKKYCFAFRQLVFLPYEPNLIKPELFSDDQKSWLKDYYRMIEQLVVPQLQARNDSTAIAWLLNRTNVTFLNN